MAETRNHSLRCPECEAHLVIDAATGEVLSHRPAKKPLAGGKDFDSLLEDLDRDKAEAEEVFEREVAAMKDRDRLLEMLDIMRREHESRLGSSGASAGPLISGDDLITSRARDTESDKGIVQQEQGRILKLIRTLSDVHQG